MERKKERGENDNLSSKEVEERTNLVTKIEELSINHKKHVDDIAAKVNKNKKVFMAMQSKEKLRRR
jgi:hypothetical protein